MLEAGGGGEERVRAAHPDLEGLHAQAQLAEVEAEERLLKARPVTSSGSILLWLKRAGLCWIPPIKLPTDLEIL